MPVCCLTERDAYIGTMEIMSKSIFLKSYHLTFNWVSSRLHKQWLHNWSTFLYELDPGLIVHSSNPYPFSQALWQSLLISFATRHDSNSRLYQLLLAWWFWPIYLTYLCPGFLICGTDILAHFPHVRINQMPAKNWRQWLAHSKHSEC